MTARAGAAAALTFFAALALARTEDGVRAPSPRVPEGSGAWREVGGGAVRGITVGPIESSLHPGRGYGSPACARTMTEARALGATWVSLTPFGRVWNLEPTGVSFTFEAPHRSNVAAVTKAVEQAHAEGLRVLLVPHLWVESGGWRALIDPGGDEEWRRWAAGYRRFVLEWARVAEAAHVDLFSAGVELRSWVTTDRAPLFSEILRDVRKVYSGLVTYAANWDDVEDTVVLGELDVIGINAFFPLSDKPGASMAELLRGGDRIAERVRAVAEAWHKPILFTEIGYTTRPDPAFEPWTWPDGMTGVRVDQRAQADAYQALLAPLFDEPWFAGFFVWRVYADPDDMSQEAEWGFSPRGKLAESVLRDAFRTRFATDP